MKVSNQTTSNQIVQNEQPLELKEGEIYSVRVKEQISDKEALIQIRGKDVKVRFEGKVPQGERVAIQVTGEQGEVPQVKVVSESPKGQNSEPDLSSVLNRLGMTPTPELKQAAKILLDNGIPLDKQSMQNIKQLLEKSSGTIQQKLETVQAVAKKGLEITIPHLQAVHEALHGKSLTNIASDLVRDVTPNAERKDTNTISKIITNIEQILQKEPSLEKAIQQIRAQLQIQTGVNSEAASTLLKAIADASQLIQLGKETAGRELLLQAIESASELGINTPGQGISNQLKKIITQEPSLEKVVKTIREQIDNQPYTNPEAVAKLEKAFGDALRLKQMGWESVGRERIVTVFEQTEADLFPSNPVEEDNARPSQKLQSYDAANEMQLGSFLATKDLLVTEITKRLTEAANEFKSVKREVTRNIDNMISVIQSNKGNVSQHVKPLIESTVDLLDKAILKSDITMLTDMETEKQLMKASGQLAEIRKLLMRGENSQALTVLHEVKAKLESLNWRPSNVKIQHFLTSKSIFMDQERSMTNLGSQLVAATENFQRAEPSARNTFEFFRALGLNHDSEVAQTLSFNKEHGEQKELNQNLKAMLLKIAKDDGEQSLRSGVQQQVDQALNSLTGQQLLSKSDHGSNLQNMFFNLPLLMQDKVENVKLYINSKNEGQKVDWENCSLYFLLETKKLGQTGILISAVDRNLSLNMKNDLPHFKERIAPIVEKCKEKLKEIGYNITGVQFAKLTEDKITQDSSEANKPKPPQVNAITKGFDFKA